LAIIALGLAGLVTIAAVATAHAVNTEGLLDTEWRADEAAVIALGIAHGAIAADTETVKAVALIIV